LFIILGALAAPQTARAGAKEEARKHYDRAIELVDDGQLEGAIVEFQRSYDLTHHFAVLYNIGQVFVSLAKPVEAVDAYERYLAGGANKIPAARRAEVEQEIARQKARIATLEIRGLPEGAAIRVDGKEIGKAPLAAPVRVGVGTHAIAASAEGYDPADTEVTVAGEDQRVVDLVLAKHVVEPPPPPVVPPVSVAPPVVAPDPSAPVVSAAVEPATKEQPVNKLRLGGIVTGAVGVAGIAAGVACWVTAKSRHNSAVNSLNQDDNTRANQLQGQAQDYMTAANVSLITGGVLTALGVVMSLYTVIVPDRPAATPDTHVHLMPAVGPGFAGLNAGGTW